MERFAIPIESRDRIFDRFHRKDPSKSCKEGVGLSLAREIVRSHRGTLMLDLTRSGQAACTLALPML